MENQNQNQNQQKSNTAVAEPDVMPLGDFMSQNSETPQDNSVVTVNDFMNGTSTQPHDFKPLDSSVKPDFVKGIAQRMYAGFMTGSANYGQMLGEGAVPGMQTQIDKQLKDSSDIYKATKSDNPLIESANLLAADIGYMGATIPLDFMAGEATMYAAAGNVLPTVEKALSSLPSFALGSGWRGLFTSLQDSQKKNESPLTADMKAAGSAAFNVASNTAFAKLGGGWQGVTTLTVLGGADAYGEASIQGRYPTKDEITSKMAEGFGMGLVFTILPHLAKGSDEPVEKQALGEYTAMIDLSVKQGDIQGVRDTVEALQKDTTIRPEVRAAVEKTMEVKKPRYQVNIDDEGKVTFEQKEEQPSQTAEAPQEQGKTPKIKPSALSESVISDAIKVGLKEEEAKKEDLPQHEVRNMDEVGARASEFITNNRDLALKIAKREAPEQDDLRAEELYTAIRIKAQVEGDIETLLDLARSDKAAQAGTELGQRMKALDSHDPTDIVKSIREVNKSRAHESKKSEPKIKKETSKALKAVESEQKKLNKPKNWKEFVDTIEC